MKGKTSVCSLMLLFCIFSGYSWAGTAVPVSPGELIGESCPTFSWSAAENAAAYRIEVYEQIAAKATHDELQMIIMPVISREIAAPALSWTPGSGECLARGISYLWFVQGVNTEGEGLWSAGRGFSVDPSVLTIEQQDAVQTVLKEYLSGDSISKATAAPSTKEGSSGSKTAAAISPMLVVEDGSNTFVGTNAGISVTGLLADTFIGGDAGKQNTSGWANTFVGYQAGYENTTSENNTFVGHVSGQKNTTGTDNTFIGNGAGQYNTTGHYNTFIGSGAGTATLANPLTNGYNSFLGYQAGKSNTIGGSNGFFGARAGYSNINGFYNVFVGQQAGYSNISGSNNVFLGEGAGYSNATGQRNIFIGDGAGFCETGSDKLYIDNTYYGGCSQPLIYGEFVNRIVKIDGRLEMITVTTPSDARYKKDIIPLESSLDKVLHLQGVSYLWRAGELKGAGFEKGRQIGLIAQEVEKIVPELVYTDAKGYKSLSYDKLLPLIIEAIKEQQVKITEQQKEMKERDARIRKLEKENERIARAIERLAMQVAAIEAAAKTVAQK